MRKPGAFLHFGVLGFFCLLIRVVRFVCRFLGEGAARE